MRAIFQLGLWSGSQPHLSQSNHSPARWLLMSQCSGCNAVPRTFLRALPLFGGVAAFPQRCATRAVNARVSSHAQVGRAKWQTETPRGKISLLEAEMLPDHKHILKKKRCKYSHVVTLLVFLRRTDCLRVIWLMFELYTEIVCHSGMRDIISWNLPKCYSIWIIKYQRAEIGVTYTFHSRWFISLSR